MSSRVYCIAEFAAKAGYEEELFERLRSLEPLSLREDGCIRYRVTHQLAHPSAPSESPYTIVFNEEWASLAAFERHCSMPYIEEFFQYYVVDPATSITAASSVRLFSDEV